MLSALIFFFVFVFKMPLCMAEDHKVWVLQQQEKSQELIKKYEEEALSLKKQSLTIKERTSFKGCSAHQSLGCSKSPNPKPTEDNQENSSTSLYIFVSFSMPKESLKVLALEVKQQNGVLVIRGLVDNSFVKTAKLLQEIGFETVLDPTLFKEYDIQVVPTFVRKHTKGYSKIAGNVSLAYALDKLKGGDK